LAVALVVGLTATIVFLWNRGSIPEQELVERGIYAVTSDRSITLSGESDQEILQLAPNELLFMSANGNYVDVHYRKGDEAGKSMLRSSLSGLAAQAPKNLLVQCHRSHFVNLAVARRIVRARSRTSIEFDGSERVPVSRMFRQDVLKAISD
jgi:DNA-binding LytR/AlgR family response regulator